MLHCRMVATIFILVISASAAARENQRDLHSVEAPQWVERPSGDDFWPFYPSMALSQGVVGRVVLDCAVLLDQRAQCSVAEEQPAGWGFGDAARSISGAFRLSPARQNGRAVEGGRVRVPLRFTFPREGAFPLKGLPPEMAAFLEGVPTVDLPMWEAAPNLEAVRGAYPEAAAQNNVRGRAVLSCRVATDRTLDCEPLTEMPAGAGFGAAGLSLSRQFRVSEQDDAFISQHRRAPFLLPVNFGATPEEEPLSTFYSGAGPIVLSLPPVPREFFPAAALAAGVDGDVAITCTIEIPASACAITSENPLEWDLGSSMLAIVQSMFLLSGSHAFDSGLLVGDQVVFQFQFRPNAIQ